MTPDLETQLRLEIADLRKAISEIHKCALIAKHHNRYYQQMHRVFHIAETHLTAQQTLSADSPEITPVFPGNNC